MRSMRRPLTILALSVVLAIPSIPAVAAAAPLTRPATPAFDLEAVLAAAWSTVQGFMDKILATGGTGDEGTTSTTQSTPTSGTGTSPAGNTDNGPGIDPNG